jgi:hypothetical protein
VKLVYTLFKPEGLLANRSAKASLGSSKVEADEVGKRTYRITRGQAPADIWGYILFGGFTQRVFCRGGLASRRR